MLLHRKKLGTTIFRKDHWKIEINYYRTLYYSVIIFSTIHLASCYYQPDLRGQTIGSGVGAIAGGVVASVISSDLIALGGGIVAGTVVGGAIGGEFDVHSPLRRDNPIRDPSPLFYYTTVRAPLVAQCFNPGVIITEQTTPEDVAEYLPPCRLGMTYG